MSYICFFYISVHNNTNPNTFLVGNYGSAGHYNIHHDAIFMDKNKGSNKQRKNNSFNKYAGDRAATVILCENI